MTNTGSNIPLDRETTENSCAGGSHDSGLHTSSARSSSQDQGLGDSFSLNDIFPLMVEELDGLIDKVNELESQFSQIQGNPRLSLSRNSLSGNIEEYSDILNKKLIYTSKLTDAVIRSSNRPIGIPKYRIQCYEALASLINKKEIETKQEILERKEKLTKLKTESTKLSSQIATFSQLLVQENNESDLTKINAVFEKMKTDLDTVLQVLFGEKTKSEFISTMNPLIEAFLNNMQNKEAQFVEIPARSLKMRPLKILIEDFIILRHPANKRMYSFNIED